MKISRITALLSVLAASSGVLARDRDDDDDWWTIFLPDGTEADSREIAKTHLEDDLVLPPQGPEKQTRGGGKARNFITVDVNVKMDCSACEKKCHWADPFCLGSKGACQLFGHPMEVYTEAIEDVCEREKGRNRGRRLVEKAIKLLTDTKYFSPKDFHDVDVDFCKSIGDFVGGVVTSRYKVLVAKRYYTAKDERELAVVLAHACAHLRNYEKYTEYGFNCRYTKEIVKGHGFGSANVLESEGYKLAETARGCVYGKKKCK